MRLQPRLQTLEVWRAVAQFSRNGGGWTWGGRDKRNSISDAEQLLCLMYPAAVVPNLALDVPDATSDDALEALRPLGDSVEIPKVLVDVLTDYMTSYISETGVPSFSGDTYFATKNPGDELTAQQRELDVVDSFSMSITLCLATLGFLKVFKSSVRRPQLLEKITNLEAATSTRLSAAMVGLLRSFCINVFEPDSSPGRILLDMLNQGGLPDRVLLEDVRQELKTVRASLRDATLGLSQDDALDNDNMLFECGWSWGVVRDAPVAPTTEPVGEQPDGVAAPLPYLYFTVVALDGIADLFSDRTRILGLLNTEQQRLAQALQVRWDITLAYWSRIARFGQGTWPLEDIPWRTTDNDESLYFSLVVSSVVLLDLLGRRATDEDLSRTVAVLEELAIRGRINRRFTRNDATTHLHFPGVPLTLDGADKLGPVMTWVVSDFAALLLKRAIRAAGLSRNNAAKERLLTVAEETLNHLWRRRLKNGSAVGLWDDPGALVPDARTDNEFPSWYMTERVIESLVIGADTVGASPIRSSRLLELTAEMLSEADHLFSKEQMDSAETHGSAMHLSLQRIETRLGRAKRILQDRPATANALVVDILRELDEFALARRDAARSL